MTRIEPGSDRAHPLPGRREGESGGATLIPPCGNDRRSGDADRSIDRKPAARVRIDRIYDPDEVRPCAISGEESGGGEAGDRSDGSDEGGEG